MKKKYFLAGSIVLLLLAGWGFYWYHKPHSDTTNEDADFKISATDLYAAFQRDETAAGKKFMGKVIEVKGSATDIETGPASANILMDAAAAGGISCSFSQDGIPSAAAIKKGSTITIKGRCTGYLMDVNLVDCVLKK
jgi:hypothetical protein